MFTFKCLKRVEAAGIPSSGRLEEDSLLSIASANPGISTFLIHYFCGALPSQDPSSHPGDTFINLSVLSVRRASINPDGAGPRPLK